MKNKKIAIMIRLDESFVKQMLAATCTTRLATGVGILLEKGMRLAKLENEYATKAIRQQKLTPAAIATPEPEAASSCPAKVIEPETEKKPRIVVTDDDGTPYVPPSHDPAKAFASVSSPDAPHITREEWADFVRKFNASPDTDRKMETDEAGRFWEFMSSGKFLNSRNYPITKWNVHKTFRAWREIHSRDERKADAEAKAAEQKRITEEEMHDLFVRNMLREDPED